MTTNTPPMPRPRAPEHVSYVIQAGRVDALYIPDPDADPREVLDTILDRERWPGVEWIASLVRTGRRWDVEGSDHDPFPDSNNGVPTRREGMVGLRRVVAEHLASEPDRSPLSQGTPGAGEPPEPQGEEEALTEDMDDALVDALTAAKREGGPATLGTYIAPQVHRALRSGGLVVYRPSLRWYALTEAGIERAKGVHAARAERSRTGSTWTRWAYDSDHDRDADVAQAAQALAAAGHRPVQLTQETDGPWLPVGDGYRLHRLNTEHVRVTHHRDGAEAGAPEVVQEWARALSAAGFTVVSTGDLAVDVRQRL